MKITKKTAVEEVVTETFHLALTRAEASTLTVIMYDVLCGGDRSENGGGGVSVVDLASELDQALCDALTEGV